MTDPLPDADPLIRLREVFKHIKDEARFRIVNGATVQQWADDLEPLVADLDVRLSRQQADNGFAVKALDAAALWEPAKMRELADTIERDPHYAICEAQYLRTIANNYDSLRQQLAALQRQAVKGFAEATAPLIAECETLTAQLADRTTELKQMAMRRVEDAAERHALRQQLASRRDPPQ